MAWWNQKQGHSGQTNQYSQGFYNNFNNNMTAPFQNNQRSQNFMFGNRGLRQNQMQQNHMMQSPMRQNQMQQSPMRQNQMQQSPMRQNQMQQSPIQQNQMQQSPMRQNQMQQSPIQQNQMQQNPMQQNPMQQNPMMQNPMPQSPMMQNPVGFNQMPQNQGQNNQMGQNRAAQGKMSVDPNVRFEPIDEKTLKEIQASFAEADKKKAEIKEDVKEEITVTAPNQSFLEYIGELAQDERNSAVFYKYLSGLTRERTQDMDILEEISRDCDVNSKSYSDFYKEVSGKNNIINETVINDIVPYKQGVRWAVEVESRALKRMSELLEEVSDERSRIKINCMLCKKVARLSLLHLLQNY